METNHLDCHKENFYEFLSRHPWLCVIGMLLTVVWFSYALAAHLEGSF